MLPKPSLDRAEFCCSQSRKKSRNLWRYWTLVRIDAAGKCKIEEIAPVKTFFLASFPEFLRESEVSDSLIQQQLWHWMREATPEVRSLAECCLKCFISCKIERTCQQLAAQFGDKHGFTYCDLLPFVLDDDSRRPNRPPAKVAPDGQDAHPTKVIFSCGTKIAPDGQDAHPTKVIFSCGVGVLSAQEFDEKDFCKRSNKDKDKPASTPYQSMLSDILQSFNPEQSSLATWTTRRVKHHRELNAFLLEHGVYLVSDWAILNDTSSKQLQRIFSQFHQLTSLEIQQATQLLESYHAVYRAQRLQQRQAGIKGQCQPPTTEQLRQIQECLSTKITQMLSPKTVMTQLQAIASRLREYRIHVRGGTLATEPIDALNSTLGDSISLRDFVDHRYINDAQTEFLNFYHEQFVTCLDEAIAQVIEEQVSKLQNKDPQKAQKFITALQLFYCQGKSMGEIAKVVNLSAQFQVSRLLKLKSFRADIQQQFLVLLRERVINEAKAYTNSERLQSLSSQIEEALDEQITKVVQEAAKEANTATGTKNQSTTTSLFAERLCRYLEAKPNN